MTDTSTNQPSEEVEPDADPEIERKDPEESSDAREREVIEELRSMGVSIVIEEANHNVGVGLVRHLVVGRRGVEESDPTIEALGDSRLNALRALKVQALAS